MRKNERLIDMRSYPISWDWHGFALDLARKGFTRSEIYGRICAHSEQVGKPAPQRCTMTNYLRKNKSKWERRRIRLCVVRTTLSLRGVPLLRSRTG